MTAHPVYSLSVPSDLGMLSTARGFVESVGTCCGFNPPLVRALVLATGEAVTNIVRHAHRGTPNAKIQILFEVCADSVVLSFLDEGEPFDISTVPHYDPGEMRIGGRGVFLMRMLMDEISCGHRGVGQPGNCLRMVKRVEPAEAIRECG